MEQNNKERLSGVPDSKNSLLLPQKLSDGAFVVVDSSSQRFQVDLEESAACAEINAFAEAQITLYCRGNGELRLDTFENAQVRIYAVDCVKLRLKLGGKSSVQLFLNNHAQAIALLHDCAQCFVAADDDSFLDVTLENNSSAIVNAKKSARVDLSAHHETFVRLSLWDEARVVDLFYGDAIIKPRDFRSHQ